MEPLIYTYSLSQAFPEYICFENAGLLSAKSVTFPRRNAEKNSIGMHFLGGLYDVKQQHYHSFVLIGLSTWKPHERCSINNSTRQRVESEAQCGR